MGEFELIRRFFQRAPSADAGAGSNAVVLGIGDDCALLQPSPGHQLAVSSDMLVVGRHFFPDVDPEALGHKALAVNLSDLAAMGARPLGFTLALALPHADEDWLAALARGLFALADAHACPLVGGDTTRGPLNICITVFGEVRPGQALRRDAAQVGDELYLSGRTGEARLALEHVRRTAWAAEAKGADLRARLDRPTPRNALGMLLAGAGARAAIDVSDGLAGDLGHVLRASRVGAEIPLATLPLAPALEFLPTAHGLECLLAGGDDYELLFTAPPDARSAIEAASAASQTPVTRIGRIVAGTGLRLLDAKGNTVRFHARGFDHFA
ncbi:thiamine-phosphate kinase [Hydrogenophaga sp. BPS33]|uniref:thiamine-phosphate kinase n=1 Tax=Hydrogenophaga sp. BPS33 TaxID=2651974 RepID=UPI00132001FC|nr:thiamine-phosphate kinase [Hydrogenophaga sp. BPS33]QHE88273.1 thiamine-phosphate kinase [Hydrogenophaga sp. BPS33]